MLRRIAVTGVLAGAVTVAGLAAPIAGSAAPPSGAGNCVSVLTSFYGPQQQVDDAAHLLRQLAEQSGMTFGQVARALVTHNGDVDECLAVLNLG